MRANIVLHVNRYILQSQMSIRAKKVKYDTINETTCSIVAIDKVNLFVERIERADDRLPRGESD